MSIVDTNGNLQNTDGTTANLKERLYIQKALSGKSNVSDPLISKNKSDVVVMYAVPIKNNNEIVGVLLETRDGNRLSDITNEAKFGKTGYAFMIIKDGALIANPDKNKVIKMDNPIEDAKKDAKLQALANIHKKMGTGESGMDQYVYNGEDKYVGYAPVKGTEWSVGVCVSKGEILSELNTLRIPIIGFSILFMLLGAAIVYIIANSISKGIKSASKHLNSLAEGDLC
ncbi:cache domain-containing protein [Clostridium sp. AWRP]|uniref:PDC sensor domain-containing protein n=1 Tax=Clostridium sp. AWRP TaxID=2212991 RepID=UPI001FA9C7FB|nr:cache domain-containing protein [Clostridium sp. AWRP]